MSALSKEFHKIWIEQCAATHDIRRHFGLAKALDYLVGEKLFTFVAASETDADFAAELPGFVAETRRIFSRDELCRYLDHLERTKIMAPADPKMDEGDESEEEVWPANPVRGAEELLRFARVRQLLQQ